ncbi:MAG: HAD family hydrolase [Oscillospiraceae bacterium]|nr:HAD family hydrolase [Oscillospiraceae bacterium]
MIELDKTIFVTDMDGTLLAPDKTVSEGNLRAISDYRNAGGLFGVATGRPIHTMRKYLSILDIDLPLILYNGCIVYDYHQDKILSSTYLPDCARDILKDIFSTFPGIAPEIFTFEGQYYLNLNDAEKWHHEILQVSYIKKASGDEVTEPWCKLLFADSVEVIDKLMKYVKKFDGMGVRFVRSCPYFLELLPENVSKGSALKKMCQVISLDNKSIISAGDYDNDIEMLKASDISFCPSDSQPAVKEAADYVLKSTCSEDTMAEALAILATL